MSANSIGSLLKTDPESTTSNHLYHHHLVQVNIIFCLNCNSFLIGLPAFYLLLWFFTKQQPKRVLLKAIRSCLVKTLHCLPFSLKSISPWLTQIFTFYRFLLCSLCSSHTSLLFLKHAKHTFLTLEVSVPVPKGLECSYHRLLHSLLPQVMQISPPMTPPQRRLSLSLFI